MTGQNLSCAVGTSDENNNRKKLTIVNSTFKTVEEISTTTKTKKFFTDVKKGFLRVKNSPQMIISAFPYMLYLMFAIISAMVVWQLIPLIFGYSGGSSTLTRVVMALVGIIILYMLYKKIIIPARKMAKAYEGVPFQYHDVDVKKETQEIFALFDKDGKRIKNEIKK